LISGDAAVPMSFPSFAFPKKPPVISPIVPESPPTMSAMKPAGTRTSASGPSAV
jgi:hypothetical protein